MATILVATGRLVARMARMVAVVSTTRMATPVVATTVATSMVATILVATSMVATVV